MKNYLILVWLMVMALVPASCGSEPEQAEREPMGVTDCPSFELTDSESRAVENLNNYQIDFFKTAVSVSQNGKNVIVSPLSSQILLSMLANTCSDASATEICSMLGCADINILNSLAAKYMEYLPVADNAQTVEFANAVWYHQAYTLRSSLGDVMRDYYDAEINAENLRTNDSRTIARINSWAVDKSHGWIESFIRNLDPGLELYSIMADVLYFKGAWANPFDKNLTAMADFNGISGRTQVQMMHNSGNQHYSCGNNYQAVMLEFGTGAYEALFILPDENVSVEAIVGSDVLGTVGTSEFVDHAVKLSMPRCRLMPQGDLMLDPILSQLGFTSIGSTQELKLFNEAVYGYFNVFQLAGIEFSEEGAEGAAITWETEKTSGSGTPTTPVMNFNRPFIFLVREHSTKALLFAGVVRNL